MVPAAEQKSPSGVSAAGAVTLALALGFVCVFLVFPCVSGLYSSFINYNAAQGLASSPWVGLENYRIVLGDGSFLRSVAWTAEFSALSAAALFALSLIVGYLLLAVGKIRWLRHALCTLLLLPLVVPGLFWAAAYVQIFGKEAVKVTWLLAAWCGVRYVGLPALLVTAAASHGKRGADVPWLAGGIPAVILFALFGRMDYDVFQAYSSANAQSIDTYAFLPLIEHFRFSFGSALEVMRSLIRAILFAAASFPVAAMLKRLYPEASKPDPARIRDRVVSLIPSGGIALLALAALLAVSFVRGVSGVEWGLLPNAAIYTGLALATAFVNTTMCFLLARPAVCGGRAAKPAMTALLIILTAMSTAAVSYGEYIIFRSTGMAGTWFAVALSGIGSVWGVWPLMFAARGMGVRTNADWFYRMRRPAAGLFLIQAALQANNAMPSMLYMTPGNESHPLIAVRNLLFIMPSLGVEPPANVSVGLISFMVLVVPAALLLAARTALNEKDSLALFYPGK